MVSGRPNVGTVDLRLSVSALPLVRSAVCARLQRCLPPDPYTKHPAALGQPGSIVWAEIWEELEPQFDGVRKRGETVYFEDAPFVMARLEGGGTETAWFNYSLSPLRDEDGSVAAVLNITPETTARVLVERRLAEEQTALARSEARARTNVERVQLALAAGATIGTWD